MHAWKLEYERGKRWLHRHHPLRALSYFEKALLAIPTERGRTVTPRHSRRRELSRLFYFFAVALRQTGLHNRAVASLVESTRLLKSGRTRRALFAATNGYGMAAHQNAIDDDRHAFCGLQLSRYLESKATHRLGTRAEIDMIADLIDEYWEYIRHTFNFAEMTVSQKRKLFSEVRLMFPLQSVPTHAGCEVPVDFRHGRRASVDDRCTCGSRLPLKLCHGRIPGIDELLIGKF